MRLGGITLKSKYLIVKLLCIVISIILALFFFLGNVSGSKLMTYVLLNLLVYQISKYKENKRLVQCTKYDK